MEIGNYYGGIIIMSLASPDNPNLVHYIKDVTQNSSSEYEKLGRVYGITTITIDESVYALATNAKNGAPLWSYYHKYYNPLLSLSSI